MYYSTCFIIVRLTTLFNKTKNNIYLVLTVPGTVLNSGHVLTHSIITIL